ncbi:MAG TPA: RNA polymerase factor sigma-54 [Thermodesulfobacteriota bacterium]|nr:RNA polymerase factor sigma-54 [Thermodesulfobacteriota bacterium]
MGYELKQELRLSQKLLLTPQLRLAIKLLQLTRQELVDVIRQELEENPALEEGIENSEPLPAKEKINEIEWQDYLEGAGNLAGTLPNFSVDGEDEFYEKASSGGVSLREHLLWQLNYSNLGERERKVGEFIIGNIDEDGYLRVLDRGDLNEEEYKVKTVEEISRLIGVGVNDVEDVLEFIQEADPPGAGARTLRECLILQAKRLPERNSVVEDVILNHLESLAKKDYKTIGRVMGISFENVVSAAKIITETLKPLPGAGFGMDESRAIVPDVYMEKVGSEYVVLLNEDGMPRLRLSRYYRNMLESNGEMAVSAKGYIQERIRSALWLIKSVHQRQRTFKRVAESIVRFQKDFLDRGLQYLKPLVLRDVALDIGMHESTVSRVTANKYAQTPRGIFELKYFFSTGLGKSDGSNTTAEYIKEKIRFIIEKEDPKKPLSDQQIVERLREFDIVLARRTVAKYREEFGFLPSSRRKNIY